MDLLSNLPVDILGVILQYDPCPAVYQLILEEYGTGSLEHKELVAIYKRMPAQVWYKISWMNKSIHFIREFKDQLIWCKIPYFHAQEWFIREFKDYVDWERVSEQARLSEDFIREFADRVDWLWISRYQRLSEEFIKEFCIQVSWNYIVEYQKLSPEFMISIPNMYAEQITKRLIKI